MNAHEIEKVTVQIHETICSAMEAVERTKLGFLVVVNENNEAVGVLTDGDIRRALLENFNNLRQKFRR